MGGAIAQPANHIPQKQRTSAPIDAPSDAVANNHKQTNLRPSIQGTKKEGIPGLRTPPLLLVCGLTQACSSCLFSRSFSRFLASAASVFGCRPRGALPSLFALSRRPEVLTLATRKPARTPLFLSSPALLGVMNRGAMTACGAGFLMWRGPDARSSLHL